MKPFLFNVMSFGAIGVSSALAMLVSGVGFPSSEDEVSVATIPVAPPLAARSLERAPLVRLREWQSSGMTCATHADPNVPCAMYAPGYKPKNPTEDTPSPTGAAEYVLTGGQWPQPGGKGSTVDITFSYSNLLNGGMSGVTNAQLQAAVLEALSVWAAQAPLNFIPVDDSGPLPTPLDLPYAAGSTPNLRFGHHAIDGASYVLAHAYFPSPGSGLAGDLHFDDGENWAVAPSSGKIDFIEVCVHEIGHTLGLNHQAPPPQAIMNPFYGSRFSGPGTAFLLQDDKNGIKAVYGGSCAVRSVADRIKLLPFAAGIKLGVAAAAPERLYTDLRVYRDRVLQSSPAGRQLVAAYYQHGPEVVQVLATRADLTLQALQLLAAVQEPIRQRNAKTETVTMPLATFQQGMEFLKSLEEVVSEDARTAIVSARAVLDAAQTTDGNTVSLNFAAVR